MMENLTTQPTPTNLSAAVQLLHKLTTPVDKAKFKSEPEENICLYHHSVGRSLRNGWGLWANSGLAQWFSTIGVDHPDEMSNIILSAFHASLNNKLFDLESNIKNSRKQNY